VIEVDTVKGGKFPAAKRFDIADVQVSREAMVAKPKVIANVIKKAKRPLLVTGGMLLKDDKLVEYAAKLHEKGLQIAATAGSSRPLINGIKPIVKTYTLHQITQFLLDDEFEGFDGNGSYDVVVFLGFIPYYLSRMLSALKHFSKITTISIDELYQPHARFSFTNLTKYSDMHYSMLEEVINNL